mgnify:CR=1 FL=1|jgi:hypothetical protein
MKKAFLLISIIAFIFGCQDQKQASEKIPAPKPRRVFIIGIDESGSYKLREQAKKLIARVINELEPGDILYLRRINDSSYLDSSTLFRLELPALQRPKTNNPFDRKANRTRKFHTIHVNSLKKEAIQRLADIKFKVAKHTDIYGFLAASNDRFNLAPQDYQKILIIASDLKDNVRHKVNLDLSGAYVAVVGFQNSKNPQESRTLKNHWIKKLMQSGAAKVIFLSIEEKFTTQHFMG